TSSTLSFALRAPAPNVVDHVMLQGLPKMLLPYSAHPEFTLIVLPVADILRRPEISSRGVIVLACVWRGSAASADSGIRPTTIVRTPARLGAAPAGGTSIGRSVASGCTCGEGVSALPGAAGGGVESTPCGRGAGGAPPAIATAPATSASNPPRNTPRTRACTTSTTYTPRWCYTPRWEWSRE